MTSDVVEAERDGQGGADGLAAGIGQAALIAQRGGRGRVGLQEERDRQQRCKDGPQHGGFLAKGDQANLAKPRVRRH